MSANAMVVKFIKQYFLPARKFLRATLSRRNAESLHQLRVNIRRLRNMIGFFDEFLPRKKVKKWEKQLRKASEATSAARDMDVYAGFLRKYRMGLRSAAQKTVWGELIRKLGQRRLELQPAMIEALNKFYEKKVLEDVSGTVTKIIKTKKEMGLFDLCVLCRRRILKQVKILAGFDKTAGQPEQTEELHQMRLAAKHVRYSLEGIKDLYGEELNGYIKHLWAVHSLLGEIHDYDVWQGAVDGLFGKKRIDPKERAAIDQLKAHIKAQRTKVYKEFLQKWMLIKKERVLENLLEALYAY